MCWAVHNIQAIRGKSRERADGRGWGVGGKHNCKDPYDKSWRFFCSKPVPASFPCCFQTAHLSRRALVVAANPASGRAGGCWRRSSFQLLQAAFQPLQRAAWTRHCRRWQRSLVFKGTPRCHAPVAGAWALQGGPGAVVPASPLLLLPPQRSNHSFVILGMK